jgi:hypothetical protein
MTVVSTTSGGETPEIDWIGRDMLRPPPKKLRLETIHTDRPVMARPVASYTVTSTKKAFAPTPPPEGRHTAPDQPNSGAITACTEAAHKKTLWGSAEPQRVILIDSHHRRVATPVTFGSPTPAVTGKPISNGD